MPGSDGNFFVIHFTYEKISIVISSLISKGCVLIPLKPFTTIYEGCSYFASKTFEIICSINIIDLSSL